MIAFSDLKTNLFLFKNFMEFGDVLHLFIRKNERFAFILRWSETGGIDYAEESYSILDYHGIRSAVFWPG